MADAAAAPAPPAPAQKLDDLMLAMDVVDTLRHEEAMVEKELSQDMRDEALKKRLRQIYESQGLTVTDRILDEGTKPLRPSRGRDNTARTLREQRVTESEGGSPLVGGLPPGPERQGIWSDDLIRQGQGRGPRVVAIEHEHRHGGGDD